MEPNFLIIGAAKSGTTALYEMLKQHPEIFMSPVKEPNFFSLKSKNTRVKSGTTSSGYLEECITDLESYRRLFTNISTESAIGEASPMYLYDLDAPQNIYHQIPDTKIIAILRNPVDRAYSNFLHHVREGLESCSDFEHAIELQESRELENFWWGFQYIKSGFYYQQLSRYYKLFKSDQIRVYLYEDFQDDSSVVLKDILTFLGVDVNFTPVDSSVKYNASGVPKNKYLHTFLSQPSFFKEPFKLIIPVGLRERWRDRLKYRNLGKPLLDKQTRESLISIYRDDIQKLQDLINRDLSKWLI